MDVCNFCGIQLEVDSVFSAKHSMLNSSAINFINEKLELNLPGGCTKCIRKEALRAHEIGSREDDIKSKEFLWKRSWLPMTSSGISSN
jgi:hypothetical protein